MSSYALIARLSTVEGETSDLQAALDALSINKQNNITNATVSEGQALLGSNNTTLNKIGVKDDTLLIETTQNVIKLGVDKTKIQERLTPIADATTSKAVLSGIKVRSVGVDNTLNIGVSSDVINLEVNKTNIQEKLSAGTASANSQSVLSGSTIKNIVPGTGLTLSSDANKIVITGIDAYTKDEVAALASVYATLASPALTGTASAVNLTVSANLAVGTGGNLVVGTKNIITELENKATKAEVTTKISELIGTAPAILDTLQEIASSINNDINFSTTMINALANKAPLASPTFTGTVGGITKAMVQLTSVDDTSDINKPVSSATTTQLNLKANLAGATFSDNVMVQASKPLGGNVTSTVYNTADGYASLYLQSGSSEVGQIFVGGGNGIVIGTNAAHSIKLSANRFVAPQIASIEISPTGNKDVSINAPLAIIGNASVGGTLTVTGNTTFTGTVSGASLDLKANTTALASYAPLANPTFTGTVGGLTKTTVQLGNVDNTSDLNKQISTATQDALNLKANTTALASYAPLANPTFTGTVGGLTKNTVQLGNVDNTSDLLKPISTATSDALALKANTTALASYATLASPTFTGTVVAPLLTTGRITAAAGTREGGSAWTGIIAMNTAGQEIFYTDNTRNINFKNNVVVDGVLAPNSIECTNGAFLYSTLLVNGILTCGDIKSTGTPGVKILKSDGGIAVKIFDAGVTQFYSNVTADANVSVGGNLTVSGFYPIKPYVACFVGSGAISTSNAPGFLSPSSVTLTHATGGLYSFVFTPAHPNGNNYMVFATPRTSSTTTAFFTCTVKVETPATAGTQFTVWCRNAANTIVDGDFFVYTLP